MVDLVITEFLPGAITALADTWELENAEWPPPPDDWGGWVRYWCVGAIYGALYLVNAVLDILDFLILHPFYAAALMGTIAALTAIARPYIKTLIK